MDELPKLIKDSPVQEKYIYMTLGMSPKTWHNRKMLKNWNPDELIKVLQILESQAFNEK